jgi:hypothetical protein
MGGSKSKAKIEIDSQYSKFDGIKKLSFRMASLIKKEWSSRRAMSSICFKRISKT